MKTLKFKETYFSLNKQVAEPESVGCCLSRMPSFPLFSPTPHFSLSFFFIMPCSLLSFLSLPDENLFSNLNPEHLITELNVTVLLIDRT